MMMVLKLLYTICKIAKNNEGLISDDVYEKVDNLWYRLNVYWYRGA